MQPSQILLNVRREYRSAPFLYSAITVLILIVNIVGTSLNTVIYSLSLRPLAIEHPDNLMATSVVLTGSDYDALREANRDQSGPFQDLFAWVDSSQNESVSVSDGTISFKASYALISGNASRSLGLSAKQGRWLLPADDMKDGGDRGWKCVVSNSVWRSLFHSDPGMVGKRLTVNGIAVVVVGIQSAGFSSLAPTDHPALYLPLEFVDVYIKGRSFSLRHNALASWVNVYARLRDGAGPEQGEAFVDTVLRRNDPIIAGNHDKDGEVQLYKAGSGDHVLSEEYGKALSIVAILGALVSVSCAIGCSLLISMRQAINSKSIAIRVALGADRSDLLWEGVAPLLPILIAGALFPIFVQVHFANAVLIALLRTHSHVTSYVLVSPSSHFDQSWLSYGISVSLTSLMIAASAVVVIMRQQVRSPLSEVAASSHGGTRERRHGIQLLVGIETCAASMIALWSLAATATVYHYSSAERGIDVRQVYVWPVILARQGIAENHDRNAAELGEMIGQMRDALGVSAVGAAFYPILQGVEANVNISFGDGHAQHVLVNYVSDGYFSTIRQSFIRGRDVTEAFAKETIPPCIINAMLFRQMQNGTTGRMQKLHVLNAVLDGLKECNVIGVVADVPFSSMREEPKPAIYLPLLAKGTPDSAIIFARGNSFKIDQIIRRIAEEKGWNNLDGTAISLQTEVSDQLGQERVLAWVGGTFGALAVAISLFSTFFMAAAGLELKKRDVAVRFALGASRKNIIRLLCVQFALVPLQGCIIGLVAGYVCLLKTGPILIYSQRQLSENVLYTSIGMVCLIGVALFGVVLSGSRETVDVNLLRQN
jgi:hypothetical protein